MYKVALHRTKLSLPSDKYKQYGSKHVSKAVIISGVPPYLLKTADNPEGVDAGVFAGIEKAVAADRYAFFTEFFKNFYNTDLLLGKRVSEQVIQASWTSRGAPRHRQSSVRPSLVRRLPRGPGPHRCAHARDSRGCRPHPPITAAGLRTAKLIKGTRLLVVKVHTASHGRTRKK